MLQSFYFNFTYKPLRDAQGEVYAMELERFAYIASHDLQEPLRKVQAFGSMITNEFGP